MKVTALVNGLAAIVAVAENTMACSGGAQAPVVFNASQSTLRPADADDGSSWMAPEAKKKDLLYVSDYSSPHRSNSVWVWTQFLKESWSQSSPVLENRRGSVSTKPERFRYRLWGV